MKQERMRIAIGIATAGRPGVVTETLAHLLRQDRPADAILVCPARREDVELDRIAALPGPIRCVSGPRGSCGQRNAILDALGDTADLVVFFDDDYLPATSFLREAEQLFASRPEIAVATGAVLADGVNGPGIGHAEALAILAADTPPEAQEPIAIENAYGCNMLMRMAAIRRSGARFDENLPLYGWQEDVDFSAQLAGQGRIVQTVALRGVHRGVKGGRTSGLRLGYSQIANPAYLARKGTMHPARAFRTAAGNIGANFIRSFRPEPLVDRRGRLKGNLLALADLLRGRITPRRILDMS